jgi:hypothetical protein
VLVRRTTSTGRLSNRLSCRNVLFLDKRTRLPAFITPLAFWQARSWEGDLLTYREACTRRACVFIVKRKLDKWKTFSNKKIYFFTWPF